MNYKKQLVINEILETEESYVSHLRQIVVVSLIRLDYLLFNSIDEYSNNLQTAKCTLHHVKVNYEDNLKCLSFLKVN